jgi:hypothetical protein
VGVGKDVVDGDAVAVIEAIVELSASKCRKSVDATTTDSPTCQLTSSVTVKVGAPALILAAIVVQAGALSRTSRTGSRRSRCPCCRRWAAGRRTGCRRGWRSACACAKASVPTTKVSPFTVMKSAARSGPGHPRRWVNHHWLRCTYRCVLVDQQTSSQRHLDEVPVDWSLHLSTYRKVSCRTGTFWSKITTKVLIVVGVVSLAPSE